MNFVERLAPVGAILDLSGTKSHAYTVATPMASYRVTVVTTYLRYNRLEINLSPAPTSLCTLYVTAVDFETRLEDIQRMIDYAVVAPRDTCVTFRKAGDECDCDDEVRQNLEPESAHLTAFAHNLAAKLTANPTTTVLHTPTNDPYRHFFNVLYQNNVFQFAVYYSPLRQLYTILLERKREGVTRVCASQSHLDLPQLAKTILILSQQRVDMTVHYPVSYCPKCFHRY